MCQEKGTKEKNKMGKEEQQKWLEEQLGIPLESSEPADAEEEGPPKKEEES